ncbi:hypothetical protein [Pseudoxanthomonas winnipegensis]|uniref:hypothetical protein n=1 Tax=Pseudoxanthomonas winnipegensis TaxID=2480810 RepID=UPI003F84D231
MIVHPALKPEDALAKLPAGLRSELLESFNSIVRNYREGRWEPSELNGGKLSEVAYTVLQGMASGNFLARAKKPRNMLEACKALEQADPNLPRSVRVQMPRILIALYEVRNNRGVGHVGGDVSPNPMDAKLVLEFSKWILAEFIRIFHETTIDVAQQLVDRLVDRTIPSVWSVGGAKRVLLPELTYKDKVLLLLYAEDGVSSKTLFDWVEHSNISSFRKTVLGALHKLKMIEFDSEKDQIFLSPLGSSEVEQNLSRGIK